MRLPIVLSWSGGAHLRFVGEDWRGGHVVDFVDFGRWLIIVGWWGSYFHKFFNI